MSRKSASSQDATSKAGNALDRWTKEGGAAARLGANALVADVEMLSRPERQVVTCLGAAVVLAWNDLPTDVQRTLFKLASAEDGTDSATDLSARIARFLHDHKDDADTR